jgi:endonuclease YncB( thermonuclease family)
MNVLSLRPALLATAFVSLLAPALSAAPQMVRVIRVVDGRTLAVTTPSGEALITLAGVELPWGEETVGAPSRSTKFLRASLSGRWVLIEQEAVQAPAASWPSFWVYRSPDGLDVSREVIRRGMAVLTKKACSRAGELLDAEREARGDSSPAWNDPPSSPVTGYSTPTMTYLGSIDPPHVRRNKNGVITTGTTTAKTKNASKSASKSPIVVVIETHSPQQQR